MVRIEYPPRGEVTVCFPASVTSLDDFDPKNKIWEKVFPKKEIDRIIHLSSRTEHMDYIDFKTLIKGRLIIVSSLLDNGYKYSLNDIDFLESYLVEEYKKVMEIESISKIIHSLDTVQSPIPIIPEICIGVIKDCTEIRVAALLACDAYPILRRAILR